MNKEKKQYDFHPVEELPKEAMEAVNYLTWSS